MLTEEIASIIVHETSLRLNRNINIINEHGVIIASRNASRIGDIHEGALLVLETGENLVVSALHATELKGVQPGINLPIVFQDVIVGVIGITGDPADIQDLGGLVKMTAELLIKQEFLSSQLEWQQRTKEMIIEELLKPSPSFNLVKRGLGLLKLKMEPPFISYVIQIIDRTIPNTSLIKNLEQALREHTGIISFININRVFIAFSECKPSNADKILNLIVKELKCLKVIFRLSYSPPFSDIEKFNESYLNCDLALEITNKKEEIIPFSSVESKALIYKTEWIEAERFSNRIMNKTLEKYADTLEAFFDNNLNIQSTSDALFIHRNTLIYRLIKIEEETGYNPKLFRDALTLQLAIWVTKKIKKY